MPGLGHVVWDLTRAEWLSRRQMRQIDAFLRWRVPGFEHAYNAQSGTCLDVRETRRIRGGYSLAGEDVLRARTFDDAVARGSYPIDIHAPAGKGTVLARLPLRGAYDIPLRSPPAPGPRRTRSTCATCSASSCVRGRACGRRSARASDPASMAGRAPRREAP